MRNFGDMSGAVAAGGSLVRSTVPELLSSALSDLRSCNGGAHFGQSLVCRTAFQHRATQQLASDRQFADQLLARTQSAGVDRAIGDYDKPQAGRVIPTLICASLRQRLEQGFALLQVEYRI